MERRRASFLQAGGQANIRPDSFDSSGCGVNPVIRWDCNPRQTNVVRSSLLQPIATGKARQSIFRIQVSDNATPKPHETYRDTRRKSGGHSDWEILTAVQIRRVASVTQRVEGDMSLVGPRPPLPEQMGEYDNETLRRLRVRPGLTGLAQIHGGTQMSWPERWQYDLQYVRELSFWLDMRIFFRTIPVVILGESRFHTPPCQEEQKERIAKNGAC